jgi:hypothetical protein
VRAGAGTLFDPGLAVVFAGVEDEMAATCNAYHDAVMHGLSLGRGAAG